MIVFPGPPQVLPALLLLLAIIAFVISRLDNELGVVLLQIAVATISLLSAYNVAWTSYMEFTLAVGFAAEVRADNVLEMLIPLSLSGYFLATFVTCLPIPLKFLRPAGYILHFGIAPVLVIAYSKMLGTGWAAADMGVKEFCFVLLWFHMLDARTRKAAGQSSS